jgi:hypothetical protein
MAIFDKK